eukprot:gene12-biopygen9450
MVSNGSSTGSVGCDYGAISITNEDCRANSGALDDGITLFLKLGDGPVDEIWEFLLPEALHQGSDRLRGHGTAIWEFIDKYQLQRRYETVQVWS